MTMQQQPLAHAQQGQENIDADPDVDLHDLCKGLLMPQDAPPIAPSVVAQSSVQSDSPEDVPVRKAVPAAPVVVPAAPAPLTVQPPPDKFLSPELREAVACCSIRSPAAAAAAEPEVAEDVSDGACWGGLLKKTSASCTPGFTSGKAHFKNKFWCAPAHRQGTQAPPRPPSPRVAAALPPPDPPLPPLAATAPIAARASTSPPTESEPSPRKCMPRA